MPDVSVPTSLDAYIAQVGQILGQMVSVLFQMDPVGLLILAVVGWFLLKVVLRLLGLLVLTGAVEHHHVVLTRRQREDLLDGLPVRSADPWARKRGGRYQ